MAAQRIVLVDERDNQLGTCDVGPACQMVVHDDAFFVRTQKSVRLRGRAHAPAIVFQEIEPWRRDKLTAI